MSDSTPRFDALGDSNYASWAVRMEAYLSIKGCWEATSQAEHEKSRMAKAYIAMAVKDVHLALVSRASNAKELWDSLKRVHIQSGYARRLQLRKEQRSIVKDSAESLQAYFARMHALTDQLIACDCKPDDEEVVMLLLEGLPKVDAYASTIAALTVVSTRDMQPLTVDTILGPLLAAEQQISEQESSSGSAFTGRGGRGGRGGHPGRTHGSGRGQGRTGGGRGRNNSRLKCFGCNEYGHIRSECPNGLQRLARSPHAAMMMASSSTAKHSTEHWLVDSGATDHMSPNRELLTNYRTLKHPLDIAIGDGTKYAAVGKGDVQLEGPHGAIILNGVLHVPGLIVNLVSVLAAQSWKVAVLFAEEGGVRIMKDGRTLMTASQHGCVNGLYVLDTSAAGTDGFAAVVRANAELWHRRFGHKGYDSLAKMQRKGMVEGMEPTAAEFVAKKDELCRPCVLGKHVRTPFRTSDSRSSRPMQLLHMDLMGPLKRPTPEGFQYVLTVTEDYSKLSQVSLMKTKDAAHNNVLNSMARLENMCGERTQAVRTDRGGEFINKALDIAYKERGIAREPTAPYSPQSNGVAERLNRTLEESARAMLVDAGMNGDSAHWGSAIELANYIRNRSVAVGAPAGTPWESFTGKKPDVSNLRVFGAQAIVQVPKERRKKMDPTSQEGIMMGFAEGGACYKILVKGKIVISKQVKFFEVTKSTGVENNAEQVDTETADELVVGGAVDAPAAGGATDALGAGGAVDAPGVQGAMDAPVQGIGGAVGAPGHGAGGAMDAPAQGPGGAMDAPAHGVGGAIDAPAHGAGGALGAPGHGAGGAMDAPALEPGGAVDAPAHGAGGAMDAPAHGAGGAVHAPNNGAGGALGAPAHGAGGAMGAPGAVELQSANRPQRARKQVVRFNPATYAVSAGPPTFEPLTDNPTYEEALKRPDWPEWLEAMQGELASMEVNECWKLVDQPDGTKALGCRWVLTIKRDARGNIERYKARLVVQGFAQRFGVDYEQVYAPVSSHPTLRTFVAYAAYHKLEFRQLDVVTAFLNGELEEELYMKQPPGFQQGAKVCLLQKSLYGLRQAPRQWHAKLCEELGVMGFEASSADPALFTLRTEWGFIIVLAYVDDFLLAAPDGSGLCDWFVAELRKVFEVRDLGEPVLYVGIEFSLEPGVVRLTQASYVRRLAQKFGMADAKSKRVPMATTMHLVPLTSEGERYSDIGEYRSLVGGLQWLATCTRPDIACVVGMLGRYGADPTKQHMAAARGVLQYVASTANTAIEYGGADASARGANGIVLEPTGYCDADFAGDSGTRKSTTGFVFMLNGGVISWMSKLQPTVAASTTEAEYIAAGVAAREVLWLRKLMADLDHCMGKRPINIGIDNQAALALSKNPIESARAKHIDVVNHLIRNRIIRGEVAFYYCPTEENVSDSLTKLVSEKKSAYCNVGMGLVRF
jgi:hypothetical protein